MLSPQSDNYDLKNRTKQFAVRIIQLSKSFPRSFESQYVRKQLIRSAASVAANYRAARRGRSRKEFIAKLSIVIEESDETCFWMEMATELGFLKPECCSQALQEGGELTAIFVVSRNTARRNLVETTPLSQPRSRHPVLP
jgi:four helix bundle protein